MVTNGDKNQITLNPIIHEAARLKLVVALNECESADFTFLLLTTGLSRGNLCVHMSKLVQAGYVDEKKGYLNKKPHTEYTLTPEGQVAYKNYLKDFKSLVNQ